MPVAEISLSALRHNYAAVRAWLEPRCLILPVIKSDAYGHGLVPVARALAEAGADRFGLATVEEGATLRAQGVGHAPALVILGATLEDQAPAIVRHGLTPVVSRFGMAEALHRAATAAGRVVPVHLKVDTGMGRLGLDPSEAPAVIEAVGRLDGVRLEGVMTHLADTDLATPSTGHDQVARFQVLCRQLETSGGVGRGGRPLYHVANSAAIVTLPATSFDMVRPGLLLYGSYPSLKCPRPLALRPVMTVKSRIVHLRRLPAGHGTGYGHTFITRRASVIATVPVGYAHGYLRALSNRGIVEIRGRQAPVVGSVCMDMTMVDVTEIGDITLGDEVVLLNGGERDGGHTVRETPPTAEALAEAAGTVPHEILCALGSRLARVYTA